MGLWAIGCPAAGTCVAAGHYLGRDGQPRFLADTLSGGAWTAAAVSLPADAAADQKWSQYADTTVGGIAGEPGGYCVASAGYVTKADAIVPLIETLSGGTWTAARAPLPADAVSGSGQADAAYLDLDACAGAGSCVIVGSYPAADGTVEGLIETAAPGRELPIAHQRTAPPGSADLPVIADRAGGSSAPVRDDPVRDDPGFRPRRRPG